MSGSAPATPPGPFPDPIRPPPGAGRLRRAVAPLAGLLGPRRILESVFGNSLLEISGREASSGQALSLLYAGAGRNLGYLVNCLYDDFAVEETLRLRDPFALQRAILERQRDADVLVIDSVGSMARRRMIGPALHVPTWVRQRLALARDWPATAARLSRNACRRAERDLRDGGYSLSFSTGTRDFFVFYHRLYQPGLKRRFAAEAAVVPLDRFMAVCRRGYLVQVRQEGRMRAAVLLQRFGRQLVSVWGGVELGAGGVPLPGLSDLLDYCTIRHAWQQRCRSLDLGPSRARLFDGVLQYKKKWGGRVGLPRLPRRHLIIRPLRMNAAVAGFLGTAGFLVRDRSRPVAKLLFENPPGAAALAKLLERFAAEGIAGYELFSLHGFDAQAQAWAAASSEPVALIDLGTATDPAAEFCRPARASRG